MTAWRKAISMSPGGERGRPVPDQGSLAALPSPPPDFEHRDWTGDDRRRQAASGEWPRSTTRYSAEREAAAAAGHGTVRRDFEDAPAPPRRTPRPRRPGRDASSGHTGHSGSAPGGRDTTARGRRRAPERGVGAGRPPPLAGERVHSEHRAHLRRRPAREEGGYGFPPVQPPKLDAAAST